MIIRPSRHAKCLTKRVPRDFRGFASVRGPKPASDRDSLSPCARIGLKTVELETEAKASGQFGSVAWCLVRGDSEGKL